MFEAHIFTMLDNFHFLRPVWLLLLLPACAAAYLLMQRQRQNSVWSSVIDPQLIDAMLSTSTMHKKLPSWPYWLMAWVIASIALAGPTFKKLPQPVNKNQHALIIMLDMSASMAAQDVKPSRATRAVQKITDIVRTRRDGLTALIAYAGDAYTVTPLTDDTQTIQTLLPALSPFIMPSAGSRPDKAIALAKQLVLDSGLHKADLLLITDGVIDKDSARVKRELTPGLTLNIIGIGTDNGAPIPLPNGGFLRDSNGKIIIPTLNTDALNSFSAAVDGRWLPMTIDDSDWMSLIDQQAILHNNQPNTDSVGSIRQFDTWRDDGFWLVFLLLPFSLLLFRRGALAFIPFLVLLPLSDPSFANDEIKTFSVNSPWSNAWRTPDQQGMQLFPQDPTKAAQVFENIEWQGAASYNAGDFESAANAYNKAEPTSTNLYNLGNALAQSNRLEEALDAYNKALEQQPEFPQAERNKKLVDDLLKQQQKQQQSDSDSNNQGQPDQNQEGNNGQQKQQESGQGHSSDQKPESDGHNNDQQASQQQAKEPQVNNTETNQNSDPTQSKNNEQANNQTDRNKPDSTKENNSTTESTSGQQEQNQQQAMRDNGQSKDSTDIDTQAAYEGLSREEQAAMEKWLQRVPDNPGNLLQRKFLYQYRQQETNSVEQGDVLW